MTRQTQTNFTADSFAGNGKRQGGPPTGLPKPERSEAEEPKKAAAPAKKAASSKGNENNAEPKKAAEKR